MRKIAIVASILLLLILGLVGYRLLNKPHRSVAEEKGISVNAHDIFSSFQKDEASANAKYLDKVVEVTGKILSLNTNAEKKSVVTLEAGDPLFGINCTLANSATDLTIGDSVTIKGICTGYLSDVVLTNCVTKNIQTIDKQQ